MGPDQSEEEEEEEEAWVLSGPSEMCDIFSHERNELCNRQPFWMCKKDALMNLPEQFPVLSTVCRSLRRQLPWGENARVSCPCLLRMEKPSYDEADLQDFTTDLYRVSRVSYTC